MNNNERVEEVADSIMNDIFYDAKKAGKEVDSTMAAIIRWGVIVNLREVMGGITIYA